MSPSPYPYFFLLLLAYLILEILWLLIKKESFIIHAFKYFIKSLLDIANEIIKGKSGQRFCGILVAIQSIAAVVLLIWFFQSSFTIHEFKPILFILLFILFFVPGLMLLTYYINRRTIAYCNKNLSD